MVNHPNRSPVYRVALVNGRFDHVVGKAAALRCALELLGEDGPISEADLIREWGVKIERVSAAHARSVGL